MPVNDKENMNGNDREERIPVDEDLIEEIPEEPQENAESEPLPEERSAEEETPPEEELTPEEQFQRQYQALEDKFLRLMAEYDNFRKRSQRERENIYPEATAAAVSKFLPVLDNFERAMQSECSDENFKTGIQMIQDALLETLRRMNVEEFGEVGESFDPCFHNAVMHIEDDSLGENVIAEVFQKGYRLGEHIIRHAMVKIAN